MQRTTISAAVVLCYGSLFGQSARWQTVIPEVSENGLHAIALSPELLGASRFDLGDIRLVDSVGHAVPYVIEEMVTHYQPGRFEPYALLRNEVLSHSTVIELERPVSEQLEDLQIWIRPTQVHKRVRVTGSDDRSAWYMVKDDHVVAQGAHGDPPHQVLLVEIPRSDYHYLRITLNDSLTPPMKVLGVGRFLDGPSVLPVFTRPEPLHYAQRDSGTTSVLRIARSTPILIERLGFDVGDTGTFRRTGAIVTWHKVVVGRGRKQRTERRTERHGPFFIASDLDRHVDLDPLRADSLDIVIENGDDRPVRITGLWAAARQRVLLARLDPGMRYILTTGDRRSDAPRYDMAHFADELPVPIDTLSHGALMSIAAATPPDPSFDPSRMWIWAAIIALMLGMGWMAMRMLRKS